jgi:hypothetical protein
MPCTKHCRLCGKAFRGEFPDVMAKLRRHRKREHPTEHRKSVKKTLKTKGKYDPLKVRKGLTNKPKVHRFIDQKARGLIRVLYRKDGTYFPEFALYTTKKAHIIGSLIHASLKEESKGKWVLRTNKFNIFVYI